MDKYYTYRPLLDLIGKSEGTDRGRKYNETLGYGAYTGGDVDLVSMSLSQIDALQTRMLQHKNNKLNSSAVGRYQVIRTTLREVKDVLNLSDSALYNADMQDRLGCYLLGLRGVDKYLSGRLSETTFINNLAKEWASLPNSSGVGHYKGQRASVTLSEVKRVLMTVRERHKQGQPVNIPDKAMGEVEHDIKSKTGLWGGVVTAVGAVGAAVEWMRNQDFVGIIAFGGVAVCGVLILTFLGPKIASSIRKIRDELAP